MSLNKRTAYTTSLLRKRSGMPPCSSAAASGEPLSSGTLQQRCSEGAAVEPRPRQAQHVLRVREGAKEPRDRNSAWRRADLMTKMATEGRT